MPWKSSDSTKHKKGLSEQDQKKWASIANSVRKDCIEDGGSEEYCDGKAIRIANSKVGKTNNNMEKYSQLNNNYKIQRKQHQGKDYMVVPVVMMTEGVRNGSRGPLLHTADEFGRIPASWNGIPIVLNHPKDKDGNDVPANDPEILDHYGTGWIYNTRVDNKRLAAEAWLEEDRLKQISESTHKRVMDGQPLEISLGIFNDKEDNSGTYEDKKYEAIARNHRPDHLALLPDSIGACSWDDGCGLGRNEKKKGGENEMSVNYQLIINSLSYSGTETSDWSAPSLGSFDVKSSSWDDLDKSEKAKVAGHFMIGSSSAEDFADLHYPVVGSKTGKLNENALRAVISGRGAALKGVSAETKSAARRRAYSLLNNEFDAELEVPENLEFDADLESFSKYQSKVRIRKEKGGKTMTKVEKVESLVNNENTKFTEEDQKWLESLEDVQLDKLMPDANDSKPCCPEKVDALIANDSTAWEEKDKKWLLEQNEATLDKLTPKEDNATKEKPGNNAGADDKKKGEADDTKSEVTKETIQQVFSQYEKPEQFIKDFYPSELQDEALTGLRLYREKRASMVEEIANHSQSFSKEELQSWTNEQLEKLHGAVVPKADYSAFGQGASLVGNENQEGSLVPMEVLEAQARARESENKK